MLDIKLIREKPDVVRSDLRKRGDRERAALLEKLIADDRKLRDVMADADKLKNRRNAVTQEVAKLKREKKDAPKMIAEMRDASDKIKKLDGEAGKLQDSIRQALLRMPNILHESVPVGKDDSENVEIRKWGVPCKFGFAPKGHEELGIALGVLDIGRAAKISGARFYFLRNDLVKLNVALVKAGLEFMSKKGYALLQPPYMIGRSAYEGVTDLADFDSVLYKVEGEDLHLIATSEHPLVSMFMDETLLGKDLPLKCAGTSPCFRREAGSHGKDTKGIFRVHQFEKVEQVVFSRPEDSWALHEELLKNTEEFYQLLGIPYRVVSICTGDIGIVAAKKYDIEGWFPAQARYRELCSCSNCTDWQARRLNIKFREKEGAAPKGPVHTLNSTLVATERMIACIMENNQQADGTIAIPEALRPHMNGAKRIEKQY